TDVPTSVITGNVGTSPITGASITGLGCSEVTGTIYTVDDTGPACRVVDATLLTAAVSDMEAAYTDAAGRIPTDYLNIGPGGDLAGLTLGPGVYTFTTGVTISNDVTLSGNSNDVWIFQIPGTLDISSGKQVILSGGAQRANIYWVVADATTLGTTSVFEGNILSKTNIAVQTGATLNGRALAQTEVTLDQNTIRTSVPAPAPVSNNGGSYDNNSDSYPNAPNAVSESAANSGTSASAQPSGQLAPSASEVVSEPVVPVTASEAPVAASAAPGSGYKAPVQVPAAVPTMATDASTSLPVAGIVIVAALAVIGGIVYLVRRN
ncbi:MAG: ice-binding family protein, partial [Methanoregula sp.]|nr:ice-binding family protein [Methanoregula sp.]